MDDFVFTYNDRWIGNYVLSALGLIVLFYFAGRRERPSWLAGAGIFAALFVVLFVTAGFVESGDQRPGGGLVLFSGRVVITFYSALPIQVPCNWLLGEDNFVEEHLMIPTALMVWGTVGAAVGAVGARLVRRSGRGG